MQADGHSYYQFDICLITFWRPQVFACGLLH